MISTQDTVVMTYTLTENKTFFFLLYSGIGLERKKERKKKKTSHLNEYTRPLLGGGNVCVCGGVNFQTAGFIFEDSHLFALSETPGPPCDQLPFYSQCHHKPRSTPLEFSYQVQLL